MPVYATVRCRIIASCAASGMGLVPVTMCEITLRRERKGGCHEKPAGKRKRAISLRLVRWIIKTFLGKCSHNPIFGEGGIP